MKAYELNETADPTEQDLRHVAEWLDVEPHQIQLELTRVPMTLFQDQPERMFDAYSRFPKERQRTEEILKLINAGKPLYPVYVEKDDPSMFVLEGRHRLVAFWMAGMKDIPVARVSVKTQED